MERDLARIAKHYITVMAVKDSLLPELTVMPAVANPFSPRRIEILKVLSLSLNREKYQPLYRVFHFCYGFLPFNFCHSFLIKKEIKRGY